MSNTFTYSIWQPVRPDYDDYGRNEVELAAVERRRVYRGTVTVGDPGLTGDSTLWALEALFEQFNIAHPADFTGHSLSVNDVVVLDDAHAFRCASRGWEPCPMPHPTRDAVIARQSAARRYAARAAEKARGFDQRAAAMVARQARRQYAAYVDAVR